MDADVLVIGAGLAGLNAARLLCKRLAMGGVCVRPAGRWVVGNSSGPQQRFHGARLDVGLPDGNGFDVARHLREVSPPTAMLFLPATGTQEDRIAVRELDRGGVWLPALGARQEPEAGDGEFRRRRGRQRGQVAAVAVDDLIQAAHSSHEGRRRERRQAQDLPPGAIEGRALLHIGAWAARHVERSRVAAGL